MSNTLLAWFVSLAVLTYLALFRRPAWGFSVYCLTFFACPPFWWWGGQIRGYSWNLYGGLILLAAVLLEYLRLNKSTVGKSNKKHITLSEHQNEKTPFIKLPQLNLLVFLMFLNNSFVHFFIAGGSSLSASHYVLMLKIMFLFYLMQMIIKTHKDLRIVIISLMLGIAFIGFQVTINEAGHITAGRLEGVGAPGASDANLLACLIVSFLPFSGALIMTAESKWLKAAAFLCAPFIFNLLLLCSSRGAFLACLTSGFFLILFSRRKEWKITIIAVVLSIAAVVTLLNDPEIIERFKTTFVAEEDQDSSASSRLLFWKAALDMISDYPLGAGGHGFKRKYGRYYLDKYGVERDVRAVHNGYLNEACEWGIQGLILKLLLLMFSALAALRASNIVLKSYGNHKVSFLGKSLVAGLVGFLVATLFLDSLDAEWGYWMAAILYSYAKLVQNGNFHNPDTGF